ncbi:hypothetical protein JTE90_006728 [Oedothorax gibbosus]|uniref:Uncharacterized protein n=1 Tax=Oedothorax gibbosus TaxID=931172 RepID=A0AAV6U7X2_9ARAC|nr:hypothetical protein JTE90_006728 [Oedothorax gibbosus]
MIPTNPHHKTQQNHREILKGHHKRFLESSHPLLRTPKPTKFSRLNPTTLSLNRCQALSLKGLLLPQ